MSPLHQGRDAVILMLRWHEQKLAERPWSSYRRRKVEHCRRLIERYTEHISKEERESLEAEKPLR